MTKLLHYLKAFVLFLLLQSPFTFAEKVVFSHQLKVGDVILISLNCMQCRYIESETGAPYSHSSIVLQTIPNILVAQALGSVHVTTLDKFLKPMTPKSIISVMRPREFQNNSLSDKLVKIYYSNFDGLPFDGQYLWENVDEWGREKIYCSELILKLLNTVLTKSIEPEILIYQKHFDYWDKVFKGNVPQNEWGNSPASLFRDRENFEYIGQLTQE